MRFAPLVLAFALAAISCVACSSRTESGRAAATSASVVASISYESRDLDAEGVDRLARYQERYVRDGSTVWIERVLPPHAPAAGGDEPDLRVAARWYNRRIDGGVTVRLVSERARTIVDVGPESYQRLGISSRFEIARSLIDRGGLAPMKRAAPSGARWYRGDLGNGELRVLWSDHFEMPLYIVTESKDGRSRTRMSIVPADAAAGTRMPWQLLAGYNERDLSDFED